MPPRYGYSTTATAGGLVTTDCWTGALGGYRRAHTEIALTVRLRPQVIRTRPRGALNRRPQGRFFSMAMTAPRASIQPILPTPTANIRSISDQQQPTQKIP